MILKKKLNTLLRNWRVSYTRLFLNEGGQPRWAGINLPTKKLIFSMEE